ncbi:MAG TPA: hypothetical protein VJA18_02870 [Candidatus Nanoarchaeia archaeon]|nr:hypothetical protein [Candidatus Nanoarchaeia archaeon]
MKKVGSSKKSSRHHVLLVSVFAIIIFLAVVVFVLQRNTYLGAVAGKAIQQTKELALTEEEAVIAAALQQGKDTVFIRCPPSLGLKLEQWNLPQGWEVELWKPVEVQCFNYKISCYYADDPAITARADQVVLSHSFESHGKIKSCSPLEAENGFGCDCGLDQN